MILLDTDHLTVLFSASGQRFGRLAARLAGATEPIGTSIVSIEEVMRGWLAAIASESRVERQVVVYQRLSDLLARCATFPVVTFDPASATKFTELRAVRRRTGTQDLKIAAVAITRGALLLPANRRDFETIPGLRFDNWMD